MTTVMITGTDTLVFTQQAGELGAGRILAWVRGMLSVIVTLAVALALVLPVARSAKSGRVFRLVAVVAALGVLCLAVIPGASVDLGHWIVSLLNLS
jgi:hypothetical protein